MRRITLALVLLAGVAAMYGLQPVAAQTRQSHVVSDNPVNWTPHVEDGIVYAIAAVGDTVVVGGSFSRISEADGSGTAYQDNIFAFDRSTGKIDHSFHPSVDGPVYALAPGDANTVYAGGEFAQVNGSDQAGLTRLHLSDGSRTASSIPTTAEGGEVRTLGRGGDRLYVGGAFKTIGGQSRRALARVDTDTDRVDTGFNISIEQPRSGRLRVTKLAISPGGTRLVVDGTFTRVAGHDRDQIAMIDTGASPARVSGWYTRGYEGSCHTSTDTYLHGVDFAPDGSYFVVVTSGHRGTYGPMCDTAARFETASDGDQHPTWVNHTGGDSLYAVAITGAAVYVGGHQRWLDNPGGRDSAGPGAVSRPGIAAIDPDTGKALSWNPTRTRGIGVQCLLATPGALWVASDTDQLGHEHHGRIGAFPLG